MKIHIVKSGDTLYDLSQKYGVDLEKLIAANPQIADPNAIEVGMKVKIPSSPMSVEPPSDYLYKHLVVQGDTLWKLGKAWGIPLAEMISANPQLKNPNVLMTGEIVYIPKLGKQQHHHGQTQHHGHLPDNKKNTSQIVVPPTAPVAPIETPPKEVAPIETAPKEVAPIETAPKEAAPMETTPKEIAPIETAPAPKEMAPVETLPKEVSPMETSPKGMEPMETTPNFTSPISSMPNFTSPISSIPNISMPNVTSPSMEMPKAGFAFPEAYVPKAPEMPAVPPFQQFQMPAVEVSLQEQEINIYEQAPVHHHMHHAVNPIHWAPQEMPCVDQMPAFQQMPMFPNYPAFTPTPAFPAMPIFEHAAPKSDCGCGCGGHGAVQPAQMFNAFPEMYHVSPEMFGASPNMMPGFSQQPSFFPYGQSEMQLHGFPGTAGVQAPPFPGAAYGPMFNSPFVSPYGTFGVQQAEKECDCHKRGNEQTGVVSAQPVKEQEPAPARSASRKKKPSSAKAAINSLIRKNSKKKQERIYRENIPWVNR